MEILKDILALRWFVVWSKIDLRVDANVAVSFQILHSRLDKNKRALY